MDLYIYKADVIKITDGDTITVNIDLGFDTALKNQKVRLYGIDTPESRINLKRYPERIQQKELGFAAKDLLTKLCGPQILLQSLGKGKYGRILGICYQLETKININEELIKNNLAVKYFGGTKTKVWGI